MITADNMVRVGVVSSVDQPKKKARVYLPDAGNMVSDWLYCIQRSPVYSVTYVDGHRHGVSESYWVPKVNDKVLVLYPTGVDKDGYILGVIPS